MTDTDFSLLDRAGLNLQAVFDLATLPEAIRGKLDPTGGFRQLILIGHGGRTLWQRVREAGATGEHPIDDFSAATVARWFARVLPGRRHALIYPGDTAIGLQALGRLAGWHHDSPFGVGVNRAWGSWFAYRAVALADSELAPTPRVTAASPCDDCTARPCIAACPAGALSGGALSLPECLAWRRRPDSSCALTCHARMRCPVCPEHRYDEAQIAHSYSHSLAMIRHGSAAGEQRADVGDHLLGRHR